MGFYFLYYREYLFFILFLLLFNIIFGFGIMFCFFIGRSYLVRVVDVVVFKEKVVRRLRLGYVFSVKLVLILGNDKEI